MSTQYSEKNCLLKTMEILGLIPARGGSKSIPRKNIVPIAGRPLLAYTCDAALSSRALTRVILSTEDEEIAEVGRNSGVEVPFLRPADLAQDEIPAFPVLQHTLDWLHTHEGYKPEVIVLLQPTSPLRQAKHIDEAVGLLLEKGADSVVSVVEVPHQYNPLSVMKIENGRLLPFLPGEGIQVLRRQDKPRVYARNGPAVLVSRTSVIKRTASLYGDLLIPYVMGWPESIDIDTYMDVVSAEFFLRGDHASSNGR